MKKTAKILCLLLALVLCVGVLPSVGAMAESVIDVEETKTGNDVLTVQTRSNKYKFNVKKTPYFDIKYCNVDLSVLEFT